MGEVKVKESRGREILVGAAIMVVLTVVVVGFLIGWRLIPGWVGEAFGMVAGIMSTPFFMEGSFVLIGLLVVVGLNAWRRNKEGDEFVDLEQTEPAGNGKTDSK